MKCLSQITWTLLKSFPTCFEDFRDTNQATVSAAAVTRRKAQDTKASVKLLFQYYNCALKGICKVQHVINSESFTNKQGTIVRHHVIQLLRLCRGLYEAVYAQPAGAQDEPKSNTNTLYLGGSVKQNNESMVV